MLTLGTILGLVQALTPLVPDGNVTVDHLVQVINVVKPEINVEDDLRELLAVALTEAKKAPVQD